MKRKRILTAFAAMTLLTGCGVDEQPAPKRTTALSTKAVTSAAETAVSTTEAPHTLQMKIGYYFQNAYISDADAAEIVSEIRSQKEIKYPNADIHAKDYDEIVAPYFNTYALAMRLNSWQKNDLGTNSLELHDQLGWLFHNDGKLYAASDALRQKICEKQFECLKKNMGDDEDAFENHSMILKTCDVPEGALWLVFEFDNADNLTSAETTLKDSTGREIPVLLVETTPEYEGIMRDLYAVTGELLKQGKYTLTIGKVSSEFSVVSAETFVAAEKEREAEEAAERRQRHIEENEQGIGNWYIPEE